MPNSDKQFHWAWQWQLDCWIFVWLLEARHKGISFLTDSDKSLHGVSLQHGVFKSASLPFLQTYGKAFTLQICQAQIHGQCTSYSFQCLHSPSGFQREAIPWIASPQVAICQRGVIIQTTDAVDPASQHLWMYKNALQKDRRINRVTKDESQDLDLQNGPNVTIKQNISG